MPFRNIIDFIVSSPVVSASLAISLSCVLILTLNINTRQYDSDDISSPVSDEYQYLEVTLDDKLKQNDAAFSDIAGTETSNRLLSGNRQRSAESESYSSGTHNARTVVPDQTYSDDRYFETVNNKGADSPGYNNMNTFSTTTNTGAANFESGSSNTFSNTTVTRSDTTKSQNVTENTGSSDSPESEKTYPVTLENSVKIDHDETQTISCRAIVAGGPPCMCILTIADANGSVTETVDNCR